jgi:hypothetical protein
LAEELEFQRLSVSQQLAELLVLSAVVVVVTIRAAVDDICHHSTAKSQDNKSWAAVVSSLLRIAIHCHKTAAAIVDGPTAAEVDTYHKTDL